MSDRPSDPETTPIAWEKHLTRAVWIALGLTFLIAALVYKGKAEDDRSAIIRWHHQVIELRQGANIWDRYYFPNPPIFPITLYPLTYLGPVEAAMVWFGLKSALTAICLIACMRMALPKGMRMPSWAQAAVILLSFRPILGDLHHANNNLIILSLIVATVLAWRRGLDMVAGLCLALAITYKVTPALFLPYFAYKRSWKTVAWTLVGMGLFVFVVPGMVLGFRFNWQCLNSWFARILGPYVENDVVSKQEVNQSLVGVLTRLLTSSAKAGEHGYLGTQLQLNIAALPPKLVAYGVKAVSFGMLGLMFLFCRTKTDRRDDPRLLGEFALVVLTMLLVSERSWKHHFVTVVLPYAYLVARVAVVPGSKTRKVTISVGLLLTALLMGLTSKDFGGAMMKNGHIVAQFYGLFCLAGVILYGLTAWCVASSRAVAIEKGSPKRSVPTPHVGVGAVASRAA